MAISRLERLRQERSALRTEATGILDGAATDLTAEQQARLDEIEAGLAANTTAIEREERLREALRTAPAEPAADHPRVEVGEDRAASKEWGYLWKANGARPEIVRAAAFGEFLQAVYRAQLGQGTDPRLSYNAAIHGANETTPSEGGFLVGQDIANAIEMKMVAGEILRRVDRLPLSTGANSIVLNVLDETSRATGSRFGGVQAYWIEEGGEKTASRPKFARVRWELHKVAALGYSTDELLQDAPLLGRVMEDAFAQELRFMTELAFVEGTGVGQPLGILNSPALITVAKETGQDAATVLPENLAKMWARMWAPSRANAVWHINQDIEATLNSMSMIIGTGGVPLYLPAGGISEAPLARLYGRPVVPTEYNGTLGALGDVVLADWSQYGMVDKGGVQTASSIHVAFTTDETAFRAVYRVDGKPKWRQAVTPFKGSNTLGPFVALAARA